MECTHDTELAPVDKREDRIVFLACDTPSEFLPMIEALASGDFAAVGIADQRDQRAD
jgi:hypothetical protein